MKSKAINNSNGIIEKLKRDLSNIYDMLTKNSSSKDNAPKNAFAQAINSEEDAIIITELEKSNKQLDAYAKKYEDSIGVPSKPKKHISKETQTQGSSMHSVPNKKKTVTKNTEKNKDDGYEIEH